jgi:fimbrial isopeptide formation D2 family protein/LPXTG-motif cell wall-anchored protein
MNLKLLKRFGAIAMAVAITLTLGVIPAYAAATTGSLTFKSSDDSAPTALYTAYQIAAFGCSATAGGEYGYTITDPINTFNTAYRPTLVSTLFGSSATPSDYEILNKISTLGSDAIASLSYALQGVTPPTAAGSTTAGNPTISSLPYGYYLIVETSASSDGYLASRPIIVAVPSISSDKKSITSDITVKLKNAIPTIEKKIAEGTSLVDTDTAAIGDTVTFQSLSTIPYYAADTGLTYTVNDTSSNGLSFNKITSAEIVDSSGTSKKTLGSGDYTLTSGTSTDAVSFQLSLNNSADIFTWGKYGYSLKVIYTAKLNDKASFGTEGIPNSVNLTYGNSSKTYTTASDFVIVYTAKLKIFKTDSGKTTGLSGAQFELERKDGVTYTPIPKNPSDLNDYYQTDSTGYININTLKAGTYRLTEKVAPSGYNLLKNPIEFTVSAKNAANSSDIFNTSYTIPTDKSYTNDSVQKAFLADWSSTGNPFDSGFFTVTVVDTQGFILPGTGGMGTTLFTVGGVGLVALAGTILIFFYKKHNTGKRISK